MYRPSTSDGADVGRLQALGPLGHVELHLLALRQGTEALGGDRGVVAEDVVTPVVLGDESKALRVVEPLHGSLCHLSRVLVSSLFVNGRNAVNCAPERGGRGFIGECAPNS